MKGVGMISRGPLISYTQLRDTDFIYIISDANINNIQWVVVSLERELGKQPKKRGERGFRKMRCTYGSILS